MAALVLGGNEHVTTMSSELGLLEEMEVRGHLLCLGFFSHT